MADEWGTTTTDDTWGASTNDDGWGATTNDATTEDTWGASNGDDQTQTDTWTTSKPSADYSNEWVSNNYGDSERRGGGGGGDRACFKCNETGHMARDCPNPGEGGRGGGGDRACFKCNEVGHMSRECPNGGDSRGGGDRACFKCNEVGHMSRECPNPGEGRGGGDRACFKCNETGHMARDCPNPGEGGRGGGDRACFKCNETGHMARECPNAAQNGEEEKERPPVYIPQAIESDTTHLFTEGINSGINFERHNEVPVKVTGANAPSPVSSFDEVITNPELLNIISKCGWNKPTPIQRYALPAVKAGRDLMGCAQTGSGKTAAFLLPMVQQLLNDEEDAMTGSRVQQPLCIIIAPTRELAIQIHREAYKCCWGSSLKPQIIYGGAQVAHQRAKISEGTHILVATPGRLNHFVEQGLISGERLRYLVLDEADRLIDDGFIPAIRELINHPSIKERERQTLLFSATFPEKVQNLASEFLRTDYLFLTVGMIGGANSDVKQEILKLEKKEKRSHLTDLLKDSEANEDSRVIVFVETKATADYLANFLSLTHARTTSMHGDRHQEQREQALRDFRTGKARILVATSVAARGLDIKGVSHVINYDLPKDIDEYVHRIGRTGRVGHTGLATSFYCNETDLHMAPLLLSVLKSSGQEIPDWLEMEASGGSGDFNFASSDIRPDSEWNQTDDSGWNPDAAAPASEWNPDGNNPKVGDEAPDSFAASTDDGW